MNLYALIRWLNYAGMSLCQFFEVAQFARNPILFIPISGLLEKRLRVTQFDQNGGSLCSGICNLDNMIGTEIEQSALTDHALYDILVKHREWYSRISWVNYESLAPATIKFLPPEEMIEMYRKDYKTMQDQMIYGETPDFDILLENL